MFEQPTSRRQVLAWLGAGAGMAATGAGAFLVGRESAGSGVPVAAGVAPGGRTPRAQPMQPSTTAGEMDIPVATTTSPPVETGRQRTLVVVELGGGNDGLSMLVPYSNPRYYELRPQTAVPAGDVLALDGEVGLHPNLWRLHERGLAVVEGVGSATPDGSHFAMQQRWWAGDPSGAATTATGALGRMADALAGDGAAAVAVSLGSGAHPTLLSDTAPTLSLPSADAAWYLAGAGEDDVLRSTFQSAIAAFGTGGSGWAVHERLAATHATAVGFARSLVELGSDDEDGDGVPDAGVEYPGSDLGRGLRLTAQLVASEQGVRIVHVPMNLDFDTHEGHAGRYPGLMDELDLALDAFLRDLELRGYGEDVLVMTTSEFGRRVEENGSGGLDHGTASVALLVGPVGAGRYGAAPSLDELDADGNLVATVGFDAYYSTVASGWLGLDGPALFGGAAPLDIPFG